MLNKEMGRNRNLGLVTNIREGKEIVPLYRMAYRILKMKETKLDLMIWKLVTFPYFDLRFKLVRFPEDLIKD